MAPKIGLYLENREYGKIISKIGIYTLIFDRSLKNLRDHMECITETS
jgi:hypothetical protein